MTFEKYFFNLVSFNIWFWVCAFTKMRSKTTLFLEKDLDAYVEVPGD